jgi:hypothetical protein
MQWVKRVGCAAGVLAAIAAAATVVEAGKVVEAVEEWEPPSLSELAVVPRGGGLFVDEGWWESCHMMMVGGGGWVPLRAERRPARRLVLYRPVRRLAPGVVYQVLAMSSRAPDEERACGYFGRAVAGAAVDRRPPTWYWDPQVDSVGYRTGCLMDQARVEFSLWIDDESPVRVTIEARPRDGTGAVMRAVVRPSDERARVDWPAGGDGLRPGVVYEAKVCADDAAGNRSCAPSPAVFTAPGPAEEMPIDPDPLCQRWVERRTLERPEAAGRQPALEERMERARVPRGRVDWRCASAGAAGAALVLAIAALAGARRAARRRLSRTA